MINGNIVYLNRSKHFTDVQRELITRYVETYDNYLRSRARVVFGFSDEDEEFCSVVNDTGCVFAHFAKASGRYIGECSKFGYRESATLYGVLITSRTPKEVIDDFEDNRKAIV